MSDDRRSFIKTFGITLGSLIVCGSLPGCGGRRDEGVPNTNSRIRNQNDSSPTPRDPQWEQLRQCWLNLNNTQDLRKALSENFGDPEQSDPFTTTRYARAKEHQAILDALVAEGEIERPVATQMQLAFEEASYHVVRSMATCYVIFPFEYEVRQDLPQRAEVLRKISGDLDPATVAKAQAAIAQDVAFFELFKTGPIDYRSLQSKYKAGRLKASPEALEAAHLLAQLFVETSQ